MKISSMAALCLLAAAPLFAKELAPEENLRRALKNNPEVMMEFLREHRMEILQMLNQAVQEDNAARMRSMEEQQRTETEDALRNPRATPIYPTTLVRGAENAKYTLVVFSDFQCPHCSTAERNVAQVREKYGKDLRVAFKHNPLANHPEAFPAALYTQAVARQSIDKAWKFHDALFENQDKLGENFYKETAKKIGVNLKRLEADLASPEVRSQVEADKADAQALGFGGTPAFLLNGIPIRGNFRIDYFDSLIEKLDARAAP